MQAAKGRIPARSRELVEAFLPLIRGVARVYRGSPSITLIAEFTRSTVPSDRALRHLAQLKRAHGDFLQRHSHEPTGHQLATDTGLTLAPVGELLALERIPQSMDEPVKGIQGELGAFGELLADPLAEDAYEQLLDHREIDQVRALLGSLNARERTILRARYRLDGVELSLREIGERIGLRRAGAPDRDSRLRRVLPVAHAARRRRSHGRRSPLRPRRARDPNPEARA